MMRCVWALGFEQYKLCGALFLGTLYVTVLCELSG